MYICLNSCTHACVYVYMYVCVYVCMYAIVVVCVREIHVALACMVARSMHLCTHVCLQV